MNKLVITTVLVVVVIGFFVFWKRDDGKLSDIKNYPSSGTSIVAFGDSLVYGVGAKAAGGFVALLEEQLGQPIINLGRGGDTTALALDRVESVLETDPKVVMVLLGGNDFLNRVPREETFINLGIIIDRIQSAGAVVVLLGVRGGLITDTYDNLYEDLAREKGALYVSNVLNGLLGNPEFMDDAIHPNDAGYAVIAGRIYPVLAPLVE